MYNIFEQPWTLLLLAVFLHLVILILRWFLPEKVSKWYFALAYLLFAGAFAIDYFIKTDPEKVNRLMKTAVKSIEQEDIDTFESIISPDYVDSYHQSKDEIVGLFDFWLAKPFVEKNTITSLKIKIEGNLATARLGMLTTFDVKSWVYERGKVVGHTVSRFRIIKDTKKNWLIKSIDILKLDQQPVRWVEIR